RSSSRGAGSTFRPSRPSRDPNAHCVRSSTRPSRPPYRATPSNRDRRRVTLPVLELSTSFASPIKDNALRTRMGTAEGTRHPCEGGALQDLTRVGEYLGKSQADSSI